VLRDDHVVMAGTVLPPYLIDPVGRRIAPGTAASRLSIALCAARTFVICPPQRA